jgi:hypothetical protein
MIEEGVLIPATLRPIGQGISGAQRGQVKIAGVSQKCVVKPETLSGIAAECFAAAVGNHLGLPTLHPVIVRHPGQQSMWFGARDKSHPSLLTALNVNAQNQAQAVRSAVMLLATWAQFGSTITFDELIGNPDRNLGNLLWDGADFWLIDHAASMDNKPFTQNKLADVVTGTLDPKSIASVKASSIAQAVVQQIKCGSNAQVWSDLQSAFQTLAVVQKNQPTWIQSATACRQFILARLPALANDTANRFSPLLNNHAPAKNNP